MRLLPLALSLFSLPLATACTVMQPAGDAVRDGMGEIAFVGTAPGGDTSGLYAIRPGTDGLRTVIEPRPSSFLSPAWSPDRARLAYIELPLDPVTGEPKYAAATMTLVSGDGSGERALIRPAAVEPLPETVQRPWWSPDGARLLYTFGDPPPDGWMTSVSWTHVPGAINTTGYDQTLGAVTGSWSPDGQLFGMAGFLPDGRTRIHFDHFDEPYSHRGRDLGGETTGGRDPVFSADNRWLAWWGQDGSEAPHVYLTRTADGPIIDLGEGVGPVWAPDASLLLFTAGPRGTVDHHVWRRHAGPAAKPGEVWLFEAESGTLTNVSRSPADDRWPAWSPGGLWVAFTSDRDGRREVYAVRTGGGPPVRLTDNEIDESMLAWAAQARPQPTRDPGASPKPVGEVLARGEPVGFRVCTSGQGWEPPTDSAIADELRREIYGNGHGDTDPRYAEAMRRRFHYNAHPYPYDDVGSSYEDVVGFLAGFSPRSQPFAHLRPPPDDVRLFCESGELDDRSAELRAAWVFDHRVLQARKDGRQLVIVVTPAPGHFEEVFLPYPPDPTVRFEEITFTIVRFVDPSGRVLFEWDPTDG